jgi:4-amino-4-deoxy-L-arabinose transferase-like glycosyltransferase
MPFHRAGSARRWNRLKSSGVFRTLLSKPHRLDLTLFFLSLLVYALTRLIALESYPIYFFTDEAVQTVLASDFIRDGFKNYDGHLFPSYFQNVYEYNLNLSVYLQVIPYLLFGKSIFVTRAAAALFTLLAPISLGLLLKRTFKNGLYWLVVLILAATPAWFLHSRTAFETSIMVSLYAAFLYAYLMYRISSPAYLYLAAVLGALVFYTYGPGQIIMLATGLFLLIMDLRYHLRHRRTQLITAGLLALLALPYARFQIQVPGKHTEFLRLLNSHWLQDLPLAEKLSISVRDYLTGLNPGYWFLPNGIDLPRHQMDDYGHISIIAAPLILIGLVCALRKIREPTSRTMVAALLAIPFGAVVVGPGITRLLVMTLPAAVLATLGLRWLTSKLRPWIAYPLLAWGLFLLGASANTYMLTDALQNGPLWSRDYGLSGMQWGAKQVFAAVEETLDEDPGAEIYLTPTWANGADVLRRFFFPDDAPVHVANAEGYLREKKELTPNMVFILTEAEYQDVRTSQKFKTPEVDKVLRYPDGSPGFYFLRIDYSSQADTIFAREAEARRIPVTDTIHLDDYVVDIEHPRFDMGDIDNMFDGDPFTMARTEEANPALLSLSFEPPMSIQGLVLTTGSMDMTLTVRLYESDREDPLRFMETFQDLPPDPTVELHFDEGPHPVSHLEIEIEGFGMDDPKRIHLRELTLY